MVYSRFNERQVDDMMKFVILSILCSVGIWADNTALFATVVNVAKNDTLNVRSEANYKAKKVGEIPPDAYMGIEKCRTVGNSMWCRIYPLVQNWYDNFGPEDIGWVNARYLKFSNRGYINIINKEKNCFYSIMCKSSINSNKCLIVYDLKYDYKKDKMIEIKSKWIERKKLKGESAFGAASQNKKINLESGYCTNGKMIDNYFK